MKETNKMEDNKTLAEKFLKTDLQSQIEFMEYISSNSINLPLPIFKSIVNSLKELQAIKRNNKDNDS